MFRDLLTCANTSSKPIAGIFGVILLSLDYSTKLSPYCNNNDNNWIPVFFIITTITNLWEIVCIIWTIIGDGKIKLQKVNKNQCENIFFLFFHFILVTIYMIMWLDIPQQSSCRSIVFAWKYMCTVIIQFITLIFSGIINGIDLIITEKEWNNNNGSSRNSPILSANSNVAIKEL